MATADAAAAHVVEFVAARDAAGAVVSTGGPTAAWANAEAAAAAAAAAAAVLAGTARGAGALRRAAILYALLVAVCVLINNLEPGVAQRNARPHALLAGTATLAGSGRWAAAAADDADRPRDARQSSSSTRGSRSARDAAAAAIAQLPPADRPPTLGQCISRGLMLGKTEHPAVARVRDDFDCGCRVPDVYEPHENPTLCAIVQSFNHAQNIPRIAEALANNPHIDEIIVCEDGSTDGSLDVWLEHLRGLRHFVIISNNLHETRCYNRAMRSSSARFFVLMQDDDIPFTSDKPTNSTAAPNWAAEAIDLFNAEPDLGVLSGFIGQLWEPASGKGYEFGEQQSDHGGLRKGPTRRIPFLSPATNRPFMYVECGWIAPLFIRAEALRRVGGLDVAIFRAGEPGVWQDCVLSYASWTAGWRVGVYDAKFQRGVGGHGSTSSKKKADMRHSMWKRAKYVTDSRFERHFVHSHVLDLNNHSLIQRYSSDP